MKSVLHLAYGDSLVNLTGDADRFSVISGEAVKAEPVTDFEIGAALDAPIGSPPLDEIVDSSDSVLIVVSDATRATASAQVVNLLLRRLVQLGVSPARMAAIFATGIHRAVTEQEKVELLTPFVVQRLKILQHDAYDATRLTSFGPTASGVDVQLNSALREYSRVIIIGGINF